MTARTSLAMTLLVAGCGQIAIDPFDAAPDGFQADAFVADATGFDAGMAPDAPLTDAPVSDVVADTPPADAGTDIGPIECETADDCPMSMTTCATVNCVGGMCVLEATNEGVSCPNDDSSVVSTCVGGACRPTGCTSGLANCNGDFADGCETTLGTTDQCGDCGDVCYVSCAAGACDGVVDISINERGRTCALLDSGRVACVDATGSAFEVAMDYPASQDIDDLYFRCYVDSASSAWCEGMNSSGEVGDGTTTMRPTPVRVIGIGAAREISIGGAFACALLVDGETFCWGSNTFAAIGQGTTGGRFPTPVAVSGLSDVVAVHAGNTHVYARTSGGRVYSWGLSTRIGRTGPNAVPGFVDGISTAQRIGAGFNHGCALLSSGDVECWGQSPDGQVGGPDATYPAPFSVPLPGRATDLAIGYYHTCVVVDGEVKCFGRNTEGQLGSPGESGPTARAVPGLPRVARVFSKGWDSCALTEGGEVYCWGRDMGTPPRRIDPLP